MILVAEIGLNHDGNFDLAYELIRQAKMAGADCVKFQFGWRSGPGDINPIDMNRAKQLKAWSESLGIEMFASLITPEALEMARSLNITRYKIASRTVVENTRLCEKILAEGKPTYVSLGMWEEKRFPFGEPDGKHLFYIYCRSRYPAYPEDLNGFPERFSSQGYFGYSDHCHGIAACLVAISRGAQYIEKHFTLNKTSNVIRDHVLSATPEELTLLSTWGRQVSGLTQTLYGASR